MPRTGHACGVWLEPDLAKHLWYLDPGLGEVTVASGQVGIWMVTARLGLVRVDQEAVAGAVAEGSWVRGERWGFDQEGSGGVYIGWEGEWVHRGLRLLPRVSSWAGAGPDEPPWEDPTSFTVRVRLNLAELCGAVARVEGRQVRLSLQLHGGRPAVGDVRAYTEEARSCGVAVEELGVATPGMVQWVQARDRVVDWGRDGEQMRETLLVVEMGVEPLERLRGCMRSVQAGRPGMRGLDGELVARGGKVGSVQMNGWVEGEEPPVVSVRLTQVTVGLSRGPM